jgi:ectoine hydroxylase-related dioxygenase (phytanoyl-CoA dioxygenase family)
MIKLFSSFNKLSKSELHFIYKNVLKNGFAIQPSFYPPAIIEYLRAGLHETITHYQTHNLSSRDRDKYHIHDFINQRLGYARILEDPRIDQMVSLFLEPYWTLYSFTSSSLPPKGTNYGRRIHVDCPRFVPNYTFVMGVIFPLNDFTKENGGTFVLPKSHLASSVPSEKHFEKNAIQLQCKAGDLIIFNARLFHRSGDNNTLEWRHALTLGACRSYMKQRMDWVRLINPKISDKLNARARRILGFDTRVPTSLDEFFLPEKDRLYKPGQG